MRVCVVGSGGREHALAHALSRTAEVVVSPGNAGMEGFVCTDAAPEDVPADMWVIGPEVPLVEGLADRLRARGGLVFGPGADGARIEGSKIWMKELLARARVPSAASRSFDDLEAARRYLRSVPGPWAIKTDGLAAGKGVLVTGSLSEAMADVEAKMSGRSFGAAGRRVVIEEALSGEELSVTAICDGRRAYPLAAAQDFKRVGDGGQGPNTGGMGTYSPVPFAGDDVVGDVMEKAVLPTLHALRKSGIDYRGVLYAGVMLTEQGPRTLEFNARFGDPEAQVLMPRWEGDVTSALAAAASGHLTDQHAPVPSPQSAACVVLAAPGYPEAPRLGDRIEGLEQARAVATVYCAGVAPAPGAPGTVGRAPVLATAGGRVLGIVGLGHGLVEARRLAYKAAGMVSWPGMVMRTDIAEAAASRPSSDRAPK
jgi:phosphoribosylamine--glycine ligase